MNKIVVLNVEGTETVVYTVFTHMSDFGKMEVMEKLKNIFPSTKIVVTFADDTLLTYMPNK